MLRSLSWALGLVLWACPRSEEPPRPVNKKPRLEVVVLTSSDERFDDPAWLERLQGDFRKEAEKCLAPDCVLLELSTGRGHPSIGYHATVARPDALDAGLAANFMGAREDAWVEPGGVRLQLLGLGTPTNGISMAEQTLQRIAPQILERGGMGTIVLSELCVDELAPIIERNGRSWPFVLLVAGKRCEGSAVARHIYATLLVAGGDSHSYARTTLTFDRNTGALLKADSRRIELGLD